MTFTKTVLSVSALALALTASQAFAAHIGDAANEPVYNPATATQVSGTVTAIRQVAAGNPMAGTHLTLKMKAGMIDVYLGPADFLRFLKASFPVGDQISVIGSKLKVDNADVVLARSVDDGLMLISLRDSKGTPDWTSWGHEIDPSQVQQ
jgi:hypothetical protein